MISVEIREEVSGSSTRYQIYCDDVVEEHLWAASFEKAASIAFHKYGCQPHGPYLLGALTKKRLLEIAEDLEDDDVHSGLAKDDIIEELACHRFDLVLDELRGEDLARISGRLFGSEIINDDEYEIWEQLVCFVLMEVDPVWTEEDESDSVSEDGSDDPSEDAVSTSCEWISRLEQMKRLPGLIDEATSEVILFAYVFPYKGRFDKVRDSLIRAHNKEGVDVHLYVDGRFKRHSDGWLLPKWRGPWNRRFVELNLKNIPVTFLENHAKAVVIDRKIVILGSSNFDNDDKAFGANALVRDQELATTILDAVESRKKLEPPPLPPQKSNNRKKKR